MVGDTTRKLIPQKKAIDAHLLILHLKFQFSKSIKSTTLHIFLNLTIVSRGDSSTNYDLTYHFRKNIFFPKCPKITQKFTQNRQTVVNAISIEIQRCLKRDRDIGRKAVMSDIKSAFTFTPALRPYSTFEFSQPTQVDQELS